MPTAAGLLDRLPAAGDGKGLSRSVFWALKQRVESALCCYEPPESGGGCSGLRAPQEAGRQRRRRPTAAVLRQLMPAVANAYGRRHKHDSGWTLNPRNPLTPAADLTLQMTTQSHVTICGVHVNG